MSKATDQIGRKPAEDGFGVKWTSSVLAAQDFQRRIVPELSADDGPMSIILKGLIDDWINLEVLLETGRTPGPYADEWLWIEQLSPDECGQLREQISEALQQTCRLQHPRHYVEAVGEWKAIAGRKECAAATDQQSADRYI